MPEDLTHDGRPIATHVPEELSPIRADLRRFFDAMVWKLHRNRNKGRWEAVQLAPGLIKLRAEVVELEEAIKNGNTSEILMEAADVANWALILANVAIEAKDA